VEDPVRILSRIFLIMAVVAVTLLCSPPAASSLEPGAELTGIKITGSGQDAVVVIDTDRPVTFSSHTMPTLLRAVVDLPGTGPGKFASPLPVNSDLISSLAIVRKTINDVPVTRILLTLRHDATLRVVADPLDRRRLYATLRSSGPAATRASGSRPGTYGEQSQ
jgi:hypothetical protein